MKRKKGNLTRRGQLSIDDSTGGMTQAGPVHLIEDVGTSYFSQTL